MRLWLKELTVLTVLVAGAVLAGAQPAQIPTAEGTKKARAAKDDAPPGPVSPPLIDGPDSDQYLLQWTVKNVSDKASVAWDWSPDDTPAKFVPSGKSITIAGPEGDYRATAFVSDNGQTYILKKKGKLTGPTDEECAQRGKPRPKPGPNPKPGPGPTPDPTPTPSGKVVKFVVVEDTTKAQPWRGDILGAPEVAAYYKANALKHRLIDINTPDDGLDPVASGWVKAAQGKDLPWLFAVGADGKVVRSEKVKTDPAGFVAQLSGEAAHARKMGNIPPPEGKTRGTFPKFGSAPSVPVIPRAQWKQINLEVFLPPVHDQDGIGACNAFASITACEAARAQAGLPYVALSPAFLYGAINGGSDSGSMLEDGMAWMSEKGTVPITKLGYLDWRTGRRNMNNPEWLKEAANYRCIEVYECPSFDHIASAVQQGFFIVEGLMWANGYTPDRDGWLPAGGRGSGGHALCGYGLAQRNGTWGMRTRNSWSASWGVGGNCIIPESDFGRSIGGFWAVRSVVQTPDGSVIPVPLNLTPEQTGRGPNRLNQMFQPSLVEWRAVMGRAYRASAN